MTDKEDGGAAFPTKMPLTCDNMGMSLRDYFAAKAVVALITEPMRYEGQEALAVKVGERGYGVSALYASSAYAIADAMLEARKK